MDDPGNPAFSTELPGDTATIWPAETAPRSPNHGAVADQNVPFDPRASFSFPHADVTLIPTLDPLQLITVEGTNVPSHWRLEIRVVPKLGEDFTVEAYRVSDDGVTSVWNAYAGLSSGFSVMHARAYDPGARGEQSEDEETDEKEDAGE